MWKVVEGILGGEHMSMSMYSFLLVLVTSTTTCLLYLHDTLLAMLCFSFATSQKEL